MKIPPLRYSSSLGRIQPKTLDVESAKQEGWQKQHILVVSDDDARLDFLEREVVRRIGNRLYGISAKRGRHD
jgi:hypothetical protein